MKQLSKAAFRDIQAWIHRNARELELAAFRYHFEGGSPEGVLNALAHYQNADGGFGRLIDPDNWNPVSTPYGTQCAIKQMREVGFADIAHPLYRGALAFLEKTECQGADGWDFTVPSTDAYPHAGWWTYNPGDHPKQNIGITASLSGFILRYLDAGSALYPRALSYADMLIAKLLGPGPFGDMGIKGYAEMLFDLEAANLEGRFDLPLLRARVIEIVNEAIWKDVNNFMARPSEFIRDAASPFLPGNEAALAGEMDYTIDTKPESGPWPIPWEWYNGGLYPNEFAVTENWWRTPVATGKLIALRNFGRLEA